MKQYVLCPVCDAVMLTEFGSQFNPCCIKRCFRNPNHWLEIHSNESTDEVYRVQLKISANPENGTVWAIWHLDSKTFEVGNANKKSLCLPWFEPDLSNHVKLMDKVRTYLVFS